jgi:CHAD domain-containing protein
MQLVLGQVRKPIRELRKSLQDLPSDPPQEEVHDLRTRTRRLEAISIALLAQDKGHARHIMGSIKPLRKAAGKVRDMDVLKGKVRSLARRHHNEAYDRLLAHLQTERADSARELADKFASEQEDALRGLKRFSKKVESRFRHTRPGAGEAHRLYDELSHWPALNLENLHAFRIKIKELRYVLQLVDGASQEFETALDHVKTQIGTWHDWQELHRIAAELLDATKDCSAVATIAEIEDKKFRSAMRAAQSLRTRYLRTRSFGESAEP